VECFLAAREVGVRLIMQLRSALSSGSNLHWLLY